MNSLWINQGGLTLQDARMMTASQNLSNISTFGYKKDRVVAADQFYTTLKQAGAMANSTDELPSGLQMGTGARITATQKMFTSGSVQNTGNPLDLAIVGKGFIQVQLATGDLAYTRNGQLQLNAEGEIVTATGQPVEPAIAIPIEAQSVVIGQDGTVSVALPGSPEPQVLGQLTLVDFINPMGLQARGDNLYTETAASGEPNEGVPGTNGLGEIRQFSLEASNVDVVEELVNLIMIQRAYEMQARAIDVASNAQEYLVKSS